MRCPGVRVGFSGNSLAALGAFAVWDLADEHPRSDLEGSGVAIVGRRIGIDVARPRLTGGNGNDGGQGAGKRDRPEQRHHKSLSVVEGNSCARERSEKPRKSLFVSRDAEEIERDDSNSSIEILKTEKAKNAI